MQLPVKYGFITGKALVIARPVMLPVILSTLNYQYIKYHNLLCNNNYNTLLFLKGIKGFNIDMYLKIKKKME